MNSGVFFSNLTVITGLYDDGGARCVSPQRCTLWNCAPQKLAVPASISTEAWSQPNITKVVAGGDNTTAKHSHSLALLCGPTAGQAVPDHDL